MTRTRRISTNAGRGTPPSGRKPRIIIAGEFSAGKTRLISGLLGEQVLPSNVTATALPPVWLVHGPRHMAAVGLDAKARDIDTLDGIGVDDTHYCVISHPAEALRDFDIIDTPGSSDPSIPAECWERMMGFADLALWCTNATQAWRQSEKSVWDEMPEHLVGPAMLLVTHVDRMPDDRTADRVYRRVLREAKEYFSHYKMASLIRPDDVRNVHESLRKIVSAGLPIAGGENEVLDALVTRWAGEDPTRMETIRTAKVTPRRVRRTAPKDTPDPSGGKLQMLRALPDPPAAEEKPTPLRSAWLRMLKDADQSDPAAILDCVDRFITRVDETFIIEPSTNAQDPVARDDEDQTRVTIETVSQT